MNSLCNILNKLSTYYLWGNFELSYNNYDIVLSNALWEWLIMSYLVFEELNKLTF